MLQNLFGLVFVGSFKTDNQRHIQPDLRSGGDNAVGNQVAAQETAENIDQNTGEVLQVMTPDGLSAMVNVLPEKNGTIILYNGSSANGFTSTFEAPVTIDAETGAMTLTFDFSWSISSGRVSDTYAFVFTGTKQ